MKRPNMILGGMLAGSLMAGGLGVAHACEHGPMGEHGRGGLKYVMHKLDLSHQQRDSIHTIMTRQRDQMEANRDELFTIRKQLREQATADNYDAGRVRELADQQGKIKTDTIVSRTETLRKIRDQLTPEQIAELDKMADRFPARGFF